MRTQFHLNIKRPEAGYSRGEIKNIAEEILSNVLHGIDTEDRHENTYIHMDVDEGVEQKILELERPSERNFTIHFGTIPVENENQVTMDQSGLALNGHTYANIVYANVQHPEVARLEQQQDIQDDNGNTFAIYSPVSRQLFVLVDLGKYVVGSRQRLIGIMLKYMTEIFSEWFKAPEQAEISESIVQDVVRTIYSIEREELEQRIERSERTIDQAKRDLIESSKKLPALRAQLNAYLSGQSNATEKLKREFDLILKDDHVRRVNLSQRYVTIHTHPIRCHAFVSNRFFQLGEMRIRINIKSGEVNIKAKDGLYTRRNIAFGTEEGSPHPHVSGSGNPCLGNAEVTLAELLTQHEFYVYWTILLDFLKTANEDDSAGRQVYLWKQVSEDGSYIRDDARRYPDLDDDVEVEDNDEGATF